MPTKFDDVLEALKNCGKKPTPKEPTQMDKYKSGVKQRVNKIKDVITGGGKKSDREK